MIKRLKPSKRALSFSIESNEQYYPGSHISYEVRRNCIIIKPSDSGMTVSRKKTGSRYKVLFDLRKKEVREAVSSCSYLEMEMKDDRIVVRCIREIKSKIISLEEVLNEFCVSKSILNMAVGAENIEIEIPNFPQEFEAYEENIREDIQQIFTVMSLFSGAGMLDWAFYKDPAFDIRFACDYDKGACESYRHNIGDHIFYGDVREVSGTGDPYNLIIGGPSCKPFSASNRKRMVESHEDVDLVNEYIRITDENQPEIFVIENVPQFLTAKDGEYLSRVMNRLGGNYEISSSVVKDCDVGGYTTRKRAIIIGSRIGRIQLPEIKIHPLKTVKEALSKVTSEWFNYKDLTVSKPETIKNMSYVRQGHNFKDIPYLRDNPNMHSDRYYRLDPNSISPTIVNWRKLPLIHPTENRTLTVAEASALMGFDKDFEFHGTIGSRQQQCGNGCTFSIGKLIKNTVKRALIAFHHNPEPCYC